MPLTDFHAKYYAHELSKRCSSDSLEKLAGTLVDAQVDLNPHQIDAALFAFKSPLSKGAILADEVGLGKTIEAGLVLSQKWAEKKRKILIIVPASLRKQWNRELLEKFFLPSVILETKSFNDAIKQGIRNPFDQPGIVLCSYQFAANKEEFLVTQRWDLVVIDEAHRLRNVYKTQNKTARRLRDALLSAPKILLTATPLQNSLMELYGLVSFIDEYAFGDAKSFRSQYARLGEGRNFDELKSRLAPICKRTLRRQVLEYVRYTNRIPLTEEFIPTKEEQALYDMVSEYLRRENLKALPASQRSLMILVMRKLLASSTFAIAGALDSLTRKLQAQLKEDSRHREEMEAEEDLAEDFDGLEEIADEWGEEEVVPQLLSEEDIDAIQKEIEDLICFRDLAVSISENAKGEALLKALEAGFQKAANLGANEKAIIFTESRRTQNYLLERLGQTRFADRIVLFNGSNTDPKSREIYAAWKEKHQGSDRLTGSRTADMRSALVDYFREEAKIMIATEAAAEGINLQFCSLVVNYDLPWNPQRIEQRIGRCHRYGQEHDVVVVNFLNKTNAADQRVYELLAEKFKLFDGVFGASDEVLGSIESGVDFEKRIVGIYQECRSPDAIQMEFDLLREELDEQIVEAMDNTRKQLLENFDAEVHDKLRVNLKEGKEYIGKYETLLWELTRHALKGKATFGKNEHCFELPANPYPEVPLPTGTYRMGRKVEDVHIYRLNHPLAQAIIDQAGSRKLRPASVTFDYSGDPAKALALEDLVGREGVLSLHKLSVESTQSEDHMVWAGITNDGKELTDDQCQRLFSISATIESEPSNIEEPKTIRERKQKAILGGIADRNSTYFDEEMDKLDRWADDKRKTLKTDLKELDDAIKDLKREVRTSSNLPEKISLQRKAKKLEQKRDEAWRTYDVAAKDIDIKKDVLLNEIESRLE